MQSVLNFPDRGNWGDSRYRGNCTGHIHDELITQFNIQKLAELFAGSGTGSDVAKQRSINYIGADLNNNYIRNNIISGYNAVTEPVPEPFFDADFLFMHPPYGAEIQIPYAGHQWDDSKFSLEKGYSAKEFDLGQMPWERFMHTLNGIILKFYAAMRNGSRMGILMGDVRRNGSYNSMLLDSVRVGKLESICIKTQHNCNSTGRNYSNRNFISIMHEYLVIFKKIAPYIMDFILPKKHELDIRDSQKATWRDVVSSVFEQNKGPMTLDQIYREIDGHKKTETNVHWKEKVRQVLQTYNIFESTERGQWKKIA